MKSVQVALAESIDRLPTGLILLDAKRRVVVQNRAPSGSSPRTTASGSTATARARTMRARMRRSRS
jgi:hypothetical protein